MAEEPGPSGVAGPAPRSAPRLAPIVRTARTTAAGLSRRLA
ncbi:hypothetical protein ABT381_35270 [Streptomyces sp. NPDC000151]